MSRYVFSLTAFVCLVAFGGCASDPLPSWEDGATRERIVRFVESASNPRADGFIPREDRIAVFDNDGTLWVEKPLYIQLQFAMDRVFDLASEHPEWRRTDPFRAVLEGDIAALSTFEKAEILELMMATHAGMTTSEFSAIVEDWVSVARDRDTGTPYLALAYEPMLEMLDYLRAHGFQTYIVSGGGVEFMRVFAEELYGVPPSQVVGSRVKTEYVVDDGMPALRRVAELEFVDDGPGKPVGIYERIGRRPVLAFGNSDGDFEMLEWVTAGDGPRLGVLIHHTDGVREHAYDRNSSVGRLDRGLNEAGNRGWILVDMAGDWKEVFAGAP